MLNEKKRTDSCVECSVRDRDFSKKQVYHCGLCDRWFCEKHLEPRIAYIRNFTSLPHSKKLRDYLEKEWKRKDGHPDFAYSEKRIKELDLEEKEEQQTIKEILDGFKEYPFEINPEEKRKRTVEILQKEEEEIKEKERSHKFPERVETVVTTHGFTVPRQVYSNPEYREYLNHADNLKSINVIIDEYYRKYPFSMRENMNKPKKKKHWWQP
jgi:hypothetical protein